MATTGLVDMWNEMVHNRAEEMWSEKYPGLRLSDQDTQTQVNWRDNARRDLKDYLTTKGMV